MKIVYISVMSVLAFQRAFGQLVLPRGAKPERKNLRALTEDSFSFSFPMDDIDLSFSISTVQAVSEIRSNSKSSKTGKLSKTGGLNLNARKELEDQGLFKYLDNDELELDNDEPEQDLTYFGSGVDQFGFTRWSWNPDGEDAPKCILGTEYAVYFRQATLALDPSNKVSSDKLVIFLEGGGACWGGATPVYRCNLFEQLHSPMLSEGVGIFNFTNPDNPIVNDGVVPNILYAPYCDGSAWGGDNVVDDANNPALGGLFGIFLEAITAANVSLAEIGVSLPGASQEELGAIVPSKRHHLGIRNLSAAVSAAKYLLQDVVGVDSGAISLIGFSAGGVGVSAFGMALVRYVFGNDELVVVNDAGPLIASPQQVDDVQAWVDDWKFTKFLPRSCANCNSFDLSLSDWYLENDSTVRIGHFSTANDPTNQFFTRLAMYPSDFVSLLVQHLELSCTYPDRYKNFIVLPDSEVGRHGAVQWSWYYNEFPRLPDWTADLLANLEVPNIFEVPGFSREDIIASIGCDPF